VITSYSGLLTRLTQLIDGDDTSISAISTETLAHIINMGERRVYREVRSRHNEKDFAVTVADNLAAIPADFESASVCHFGGAPLRPVAEDWLREYNLRGGCRVEYFAEAGSSFFFGSPVDDGNVLQGRYYARLPDLDASTLPSNALFAAEPDLFIYAALAESGGLFGHENDSRIPLWEQKYQLARDRVNGAKSRAAYSGGRLQMTTSITKGRVYQAPTLPATAGAYADNYADGYA
jgi:hypothetical protein